MCADAAREFAYPAGHKKEATYGFLLLVNLPLSLRGHGEICRAETIRERQEFKEEGHSFNPRTARKQGLAAYGQTAGVPSFLPTAVGTASSPRSAERNSPLNLSEKPPAR